MVLRLLLTAFLALVGIADSFNSRDIDETLHVLKQRRRLKEPQSLLPIFVNPFSPMLLCDWHYNSGEPDTYKGDKTWTQISTIPLNKSSAGDVRPCESVCVDVTMFESFVTKILPLIKNPFYVRDSKYSAFPYGIEAQMLPHFGDAFLGYHQGSKQKNSTIEHLFVSSTHPSRQRLIARNLERGEGYLHARQYYSKIAGTRFVISPRGDRPECYRHWEAIGLGAIPIANIDPALHGSLFGNDMMYVGDTDKMIELLDDPSGELASRYQAPQSDRVLTKYWTKKVDEEKRRCIEG